VSANFPSPWPVATDRGVKGFTVILPRHTWWQRSKAELKVEDPNGQTPPEYLRLRLRRKGLLKGMGLHYVFKVEVNPGANNAELTIAEDLASSCPPRGEQVEVTVADEGAFRRTKFRRQSGAVTGAVAVPVGGAVAALGTLTGVGAAAPVLIIGGAVVAGVGAIAAGLGAFKSRDDD
jgi:hypothetical protein